MPRQLEIFEELVEPVGGPDLAHIAITDIVDDNVENVPDRLVNSVRRLGVLVPVVVRPSRGDSTYDIVDGRRRIAALHQIIDESGGLQSAPPEVLNVPCIVLTTGTVGSAAALLSTNMVRSHNVINELEAIEDIIQTVPGLAADDIADRLGLSRRMVRNRLRLLPLDGPAREVLRAGRISLSAALILARQTHEAQMSIVERLNQDPAYRATASSLRSHFNIEDEPELYQESILIDDIDVDGQSWIAATEICGHLIRSVPDPSSSADPPHVEDIIYRLNEVAELIYAMRG
jgi:ParB/RepB/Spo0J family partition protein